MTTDQATAQKQVHADPELHSLVNSLRNQKSRKEVMRILKELGPDQMYLIADAAKQLDGFQRDYANRICTESMERRADRPNAVRTNVATGISFLALVLSGIGLLRDSSPSADMNTLSKRVQAAETAIASRKDDESLAALQADVKRQAEAVDTLRIEFNKLRPNTISQ